jgi:hypothetical protein
MAGWASVAPTLQLLQEDNSQLDRFLRGTEASLDAHKIMCELDAMCVDKAECKLRF